MGNELSGYCAVIVRLLCGNSAVRATLLYHVPLSLQSLGRQLALELRQETHIHLSACGGGMLRP